MKKNSEFAYLLVLMAFVFTFSSCNHDVTPQVISYTVTFNSNGGTDIESQTVESGKKAERPSDPAKKATVAETYTFDGWYTSADEGVTLSETPFDFDTAVTDNITLYAKWIANAITHTVKFESNSGSPVDSQTIPHGKKASRPDAPAKDSTATAVFTFDNWYTSTDEGLTLSEAPFDFDTVVTDDITLYAKWIANENIHTVRFESNDGSNVKSQTIAHGNTATKPDLPMKAGFASMEWYNGEYVFDFATPITEDITLNAKYFYGSKSPVEVKEVGDIVFNDGSTIPYKEGLELTTAQKSAAIAVIFYKGTELNNDDDTTTERTLGVGLVHGEEAYWCSKNADAYLLKIEDAECEDKSYSTKVIFTKHRNGSDNFDIISKHSDVNDTEIAENYIPFHFAKDYKKQANSHVEGSPYEDNWYLPSIAELYYVFTQKDILDSVGTLCGTNTYDSRYYWSSSPHTYKDFTFKVYCFDFEKGKTYSLPKDTRIPFCVIREFN